MNSIVEFDLGLGIVEHTAALRHYASFLAQTADQAEDLTQDCIARALSRPHLYQPDTNLRAWLFTIMRNISIGESRKAKRRRAYATERMATCSGTTPPRQIYRVALKESLLLLKKLRPEERQALTLLGIFEMSYHEAALHAGARAGTIRSRSSRGRARLRSLFGESELNTGISI
jgi:RNA polymerase sigma-70 factor (ECF subfamily)